MKIAILTTDSREHFQEYHRATPYFGSAPEALLQGFALLPDIEVHVISCLQQKMPSPEKLAPNIFYHGLHVPKQGWLRTGYQGCMRAVRRKLREIKPDIVHGQGTERDCAMGAVFSGFPNVLTLHGNMQVMAVMQKSPPLSFYWLAARLEMLALRRTAGVVCITDYTRGLIGNQTAQTWTVPNAVDQSFFNIANTPATVPKILYVGTICARKNQNGFIRAMDALPGMAAQQLLFLGSFSSSDPYAVEFQNLVQERPWCSHEGFADRETLRRYFSSARLLVLASIEDNCPMVVLEAMAAGLPVIASAVGGVPELITHGTTGLLFDPTDAESMQRAMREIFGEESRATQMAFQAKAEARKRFHPFAIAERHLEIYTEILSPK